MSTYNLQDTADKATKFEALPEDRYNVVIEAAEKKPTQAGGEMIKITLAVEDGKYKGRKLWHQFPLGEKSNIFLVNFLKIVKPELIKNGVTPEEIARGLVGARLSALAIPDSTQNGNPTNKIKNFAASTGVAASSSAANAQPKKPLFA